jgi:SAM-dependent methyltransferase
MELDQTHRIQTPVEEAYDRVASEYAEELSDELAHKPFDRKMLDWLAERLSNARPICDLGCGPGQVARYLFDRGAASCGIDLSAGMVAQARSLNPQVPFSQGDMLDLNLVDDGSFGGIAAFYSIVNLPPAVLAQAFSEMFRVMSPGGFLLLSFHIGTETVHRDEWWEKKVSIDFYFYETATILELLSSAGFTISEAMEREPYRDVEYPSRRAYIFAQKPSR